MHRHAPGSDLPTSGKLGPRRFPCLTRVWARWVGRRSCPGNTASRQIRLPVPDSADVGTTGPNERSEPALNRLIDADNKPAYATSDDTARHP